MVTARNGKSKKIKEQRSGALRPAFLHACPVGFLTTENQKIQLNNYFQIFPSFSRKDLRMYLFLDKKNF